MCQHTNISLFLLGAVQNTVGIPVAQMDDAYSKETLALAEVVDKYASMDLYDAERPKLVGVRAHSLDPPRHGNVPMAAQDGTCMHIGLLIRLAVNP